MGLKRMFARYLMLTCLAGAILFGSTVTYADASQLGFKSDYKYEKIEFNDEGTKDGLFTFDKAQHAIGYIAPYGYQNILEFVLEDVGVAGYINIHAVYRYAHYYVFVVSTGELGMSCPATTYLFTLDTKSNSVNTSTEVAGCSEDVLVQANDTTLVAQKEFEEKTILERGNKLVK